MNHQLNYMLARQHVAALQRNADHARLASEVVARRRSLPHSNLVTRLNARISPLIPRLARAGLLGVNDPARTPRTRDAVDTSTLTEPAAADVS